MVVFSSKEVGTFSSGASLNILDSSQWAGPKATLKMKQVQHCYIQTKLVRMLDLIQKYRMYSLDSFTMNWHVESLEKLFHCTTACLP